MRHTSAAALVLGISLVLSTMPALGQDGGASPSPEPPVTTASGRPDLYLDMPYYIGSFEPEIVMTRGQEHFADLDAEDQTRQQLEGLLETVGADIDDMVSGYALVSQEDFFAFVVAIRIDGVQPGTLLPAYLPILYEDLEDPRGIVAEMGGKDVVIIASLGENEEYADLYVYDEGDTIWIVQGPSDVAENTLENLPPPLAPASAE